MDRFFVRWEGQAESRESADAAVVTSSDFCRLNINSLKYVVGFEQAVVGGTLVYKFSGQTLLLKNAYQDVDNFLTRDCFPKGNKEKMNIPDEL